MVKHIVMFKLTEKNAGNIQKAVDALNGMRGRIETLKFLEVGVDFSDSERSHDIVLTTHFEDRKDLQTYADHPNHIPVKNLLMSLCASSIVVDYEDL